MITTNEHLKPYLLARVGARVGASGRGVSEGANKQNNNQGEMDALHIGIPYLTCPVMGGLSLEVRGNPLRDTGVRFLCFVENPVGMSL